MRVVSLLSMANRPHGNKEETYYKNSDDAPGHIPRFPKRTAIRSSKDGLYYRVYATPEKMNETLARRHSQKRGWVVYSLEGVCDLLGGVSVVSVLEARARHQRETGSRAVRRKKP